MLENKRAAVLVNKEKRSRAVVFTYLALYTIYRFAYVLGALDNGTIRQRFVSMLIDATASVALIFNYYSLTTLIKKEYPQRYKEISCSLFIFLMVELFGYIS